MRATNAGKRRSASKTPQVSAPRGRPFQRKKSQYENHEHYPGMHIATVPISHRFEGVDGPTVENFEADGYRIIDAKDSGIIVPPNHALMGISCDEFERREKERHDFNESLLNPDDQPQSADEMRKMIADRVASGSQVGRADHLKTLPNRSLSEATAVLRQQELGQQAALQELQSQQE